LTKVQIITVDTFSNFFSSTTHQKGSFYKQRKFTLHNQSTIQI